MKRALFKPLILNLSKIYFSRSTNKDIEYKKAIYYTLKDLGGVYVKFLQLLTVTQKFMDGWGTPREYEIFDRVVEEEIDLNRYVDLNNFLSIDNTPFACGSFAQLYKAKLKTGETVAVKIIRPSIGLTLKSDLKKLSKIVKIFKMVIPNGMLDYTSAFKEFRESCLLETDYLREMANIEYFYNFYKNEPKVVIPKIYRELSSKSVIVQEFIDGPTLASILSKISPNDSLEKTVFDINGSNIWTQLKTIGGEALRMGLMADYIYGDPHPGNIILLPENKIAFVDFGIIANKPASQEAYYKWIRSYYNILKGGTDYGDLMRSTCNCFCSDFINALRKCTNGDKDIIEHIAEALNRKAIKIEGENSSAQKFASNGHILKLFTEFIDDKNSLNIRVDMQNFKLLKAMLAFIGTVNTIDNKFGNGYFSEIMIGSMDYAFDKCPPSHIAHDMTYKTRYTVSQSYELLIDMISDLANNDEFLYENISEGMFS